MKIYIHILLVLVLTGCASLTNLISPINENKLNNKTFVIRDSYSTSNDSLLSQFKLKVSKQKPITYKLIFFSREGAPIVTRIKYRPNKVKIKIDSRRDRYAKPYGRIKYYSVLESNITNADKPMDILKIYD